MAGTRTYILLNISDAVHRKVGLWLWAFLDIDENIQKIIQKTIRIFYPFSIVNLNALINFDK